MLTVAQKIEHLRKLGLDGDMTEIEKMYSGKEFSTKDEEYKKLLQLSKKYCMRFTELSGLKAKTKTCSLTGSIPPPTYSPPCRKLQEKVKRFL